MSAKTEARKEAIIEMYKATNRGNIEPLRALLADDFVSYGGAGFRDLHGPLAFIDLWHTFTRAFPDLTFEVLQIVVDDDFAAVRGLQRGTHLGNFLGMVPATGKKVSWTGTAIFRFNKEGKIVERWQDLDNLSLFQQLGVIPMLGAALG